MPPGCLIVCAHRAPPPVRGESTDSASKSARAYIGLAFMEKLAEEYIANLPVSGNFGSKAHERKFWDKVAKGINELSPSDRNDRPWDRTAVKKAWRNKVAAVRTVGTDLSGASAPRPSDIMKKLGPWAQNERVMLALRQSAATVRVGQPSMNVQSFVEQQTSPSGIPGSIAREPEPIFTPSAPRTKRKEATPVQKDSSEESASPEISADFRRDVVRAKRRKAKHSVDELMKKVMQMGESSMDKLMDRFIAKIESTAAPAPPPSRTVALNLKLLAVCQDEADEQKVKRISRALSSQNSEWLWTCVQRLPDELTRECIDKLLAECDT